MDKFHSKTLTRKLIRLLLFGFAVASVIFACLFYISNALLDDYFISSSYIYDAETTYIEEFRTFVQQEKLSSNDTMRFEEWVRKKRIRHFTVSRDNILLYDNTYPDDTVFGSAKTEYLNDNWQYFHTVTFSDGDADVYIYANYDTKYYLLFNMLTLILCIFIWMLLFILGIRKEVKYIQQLSYSVSQIESGALNFEIPVKGADELGSLARGLDQMRLALIEKEEKEEQMKSFQDKLVLGMAHDLRTPLTSLMTFLEIAQKQNTLPDCINYVNKAYTKTTQIRDLSNQLFEFFLISSEQPIVFEDPEDVEYALGEYLSELCGLLQIDGYQCTIDRLFWENVKIQICTDYMGRIINNIVSNIKKYADSAAPIELSAKYSNAYISITIKNKPAWPNQYVHGTGIGVKNICTMMLQMNGFCKTHIEPEVYMITLNFPIVCANENKYIEN